MTPVAPSPEGRLMVPVATPLIRIHPRQRCTGPAGQSFLRPPDSAITPEGKDRLQP